MLQTTEPTCPGAHATTREEKTCTPQLERSPRATKSPRATSSAAMKIPHASMKTRRSRINNLKKIIRKDKEYYLMIKGSIHQENITIINIHVPNIRAPKSRKETLTELKRKRQQHNNRRLLYSIFKNGQNKQHWTEQTYTEHSIQQQ